MVKLRLVAAAVLTGVFAGACGSGGNGSASGTTTTRDTELVAQVASYDLVPDHAQRVIVGLLTADQKLIGFGQVGFAFSFLGTEESPQEPGRPGPTAKADYLLIPGHPTPSSTEGPRFVPADEGGVYGAYGVMFDEPGLWEVRVDATIDGVARSATAAFEVLPTSSIPAVGTDAPRSVNHLPGAQGVPVKAVDSRAEADGSVPDPELHSKTVAEAVTSGRPTLVVVSTPVYCVSRFCGPITDTVQTLAKQHGQAMDFIHLEVWRDYEGLSVNEAAAQWIYPAGSGDAREPWVFVVGKDGLITHRFDNVATEAEMRAAIGSVLA